jgi:hypothetical protein
MNEKSTNNSRLFDSAIVCPTVVSRSIIPGDRVRKIGTDWVMEAVKRKGFVWLCKSPGGRYYHIKSIDLEVVIYDIKNQMDVSKEEAPETEE